MKNIKYGLIALAAVVAGTGSAYAVSASTEAYTAEAISISAEPISLEEAAKLTQTSHGSSNPANYPNCPACKIIRVNKTTGFATGHCKRRKRIYYCSNPIGSTRA